MKAPPSPTSHEHADEHVIASAHYFNEHPRQSSAGDTSKRHGDITHKHASSPRPSDPDHLTLETWNDTCLLAAVKRNPFSILSYLTKALVENVTSPVIFHINSYFPDNDWLHCVLLCCTAFPSPTYNRLQIFSYHLDISNALHRDNVPERFTFSHFFVPISPSAWLKHHWPKTLLTNHLNGNHWKTHLVLDKASSVSGKMAHTLLVTETNKTRHLTKTASRVWLL